MARTPKKEEPRRRQFGLDEKIRLLGEARNLTGSELTAFLDKEHVRLGELEQWRRALEGEAVPAATIKHIRTLERELARKEKALAEAAALLVLKKKLQGMDLLDEDDDDDEESEK